MHDISGGHILPWKHHRPPRNASVGFNFPSSPPPSLLLSIDRDEQHSTAWWKQLSLNLWIPVSTSACIVFSMLAEDFLQPPKCRTMRPWTLRTPRPAPSIPKAPVSHSRISPVEILSSRNLSKPSPIVPSPIDVRHWGPPVEISHSIPNRSFEPSNMPNDG